MVIKHENFFESLDAAFSTARFFVFDSWLYAVVTCRPTCRCVRYVVVRFCKTSLENDNSERLETKRTTARAYKYCVHIKRL